MRRREKEQNREQIEAVKRNLIEKVTERKQIRSENVRHDHSYSENGDLGTLVNFSSIDFLF